MFSPVYVAKKFALQIAGLFGYTIIPIKGLEQLERSARLGRIARVLFYEGVLSSLAHIDRDLLISNSQSQIGQDLVALSTFPKTQGGFFVEFGATDGINGSNTHLLEKEFGWTGILSEPARKWKNDLAKNREAIIDFRCVYNRSGTHLKFREASGGLSTISSFSDSDEHALARKQSVEYNVQTVSLNDLLSEHKAPSHIDFLSIDTEGSEFMILSAFDFSKHSFGFICVEHNFTNNRAHIQDLLVSNGYRQVYPELSEFDDWFVLKTNQNIPG